MSNILLKFLIRTQWNHLNKNKKLAMQIGWKAVAASWKMKSRNLIFEDKRTTFWPLYLFRIRPLKNIKLIKDEKTNRQKLNKLKSPCGKQTTQMLYCSQSYCYIKSVRHCIKFSYERNWIRHIFPFMVLWLYQLGIPM